MGGVLPLSILPTPTPRYSSCIPHPLDSLSNRRKNSKGKAQRSHRLHRLGARRPLSCGSGRVLGEATQGSAVTGRVVHRVLPTRWVSLGGSLGAGFTLTALKGLPQKGGPRGLAAFEKRLEPPVSFTCCGPAPGGGARGPSAEGRSSGQALGAGGVGEAPRAWTQSWGACRVHGEEGSRPCLRSPVFLGEVVAWPPSPLHCCSARGLGGARL